MEVVARSFSGTMNSPTESNSMPTERPDALATQEPLAPTNKPSRLKLGIAFAVAAVSDVVAIWAEFLPPAQWALDAGTAFALFLILGRRWALLPGLIAEAIPGMGIFPVWVLVVASIAVYDGIKKPHRI
jgi:hypothetical protein